MIDARKKRPFTYVAALAAFALGVTLLFVASLGFLPGIWLCDIFSQFRLVYPIMLLACTVVAALCRTQLFAWILGSGTALMALPVLLMFRPTACSSPPPEQEISILNFNTEFQHNDHYNLLAELVKQRKPDVIALVEVNQKWLDELSETLRPYQYRQLALSGPGIALYSRFPLVSTEIRSFGRSHHPRILAALQVGNQLIHFEVVHPRTPTAQGYAERNQEFELIRPEVEKMGEPVILVGDLNCGPWSPAFRGLLESGLKDTEQGLGPQPSWPARAGRVIPFISIPPLIPIDHVLVSQSVCVRERTVGPALQSDHLPVFVRLAIPYTPESVNILVKRKMLMPTQH
jgi:endonuclease/exonuclease/phosphatase (EEP) superfamily protein YafD